MTRRVFLGVDCGTGSTKAVLVDAETGDRIAIGRAPHDIDSRPDGTSEQQPSAWWDALVVATREALHGLPDADVAGVAVSGQQHGLVVLDEHDAPIRPAKLWNDTTAADDGRALEDRLGGVDATLRAIGNRMLAGYTAPKLAWLKRAEPETYARTTRICLPHEYLNLRLTGTFATEPGDASGTAYFDPCTREWSERVLTALDADRDWPAALPALLPSRSVVGRVMPEAAAALGLERGIPVAGGGGDNMCAAIGAGAVAEGPVVVSLGTSGTAFGHRDAPALDPIGEVALFCDSTGGWLPLACTLNCTGAVDWSLGLFGWGPEEIDACLAASPPGARGIAALPYLVGERTPDLPDAAASYFGLRAGHEPNDIVRATIEGVTWGLAYGVRALERTGLSPSEVTLVGGGAASDRWGQLCADVLGLPVGRAAETEAAATGAALQARWVVDDAPPPGPRSTTRWEPHTTDELLAQGARLDALRDRARETGGAGT